MNVCYFDMTEDEIEDFHKKIERLDSDDLDTAYVSLTREEFNTAKIIIGKVLYGNFNSKFYFHVIKNKDDIQELIEDIYGEEALFEKN